jgi:two-component system sensor histidine kinase ChvG
VSLRGQLLLVSLLTLLLPWGGCRAIREMESTLRHGQENNLRTATIAVATSLADNPQQIYRTSAHLNDSSWPAHDLYAYELNEAIAIDGYANDWGNAPLPAPWHSGRAGTGNPLRYLLGKRGDYLYLFLAMRSQTLGGAADLDQAEILLETPGGALLRLRFRSPAPGPVVARVETLSGEPADSDVIAQRIVAYWQETGSGFHLELRIPRDIAGARIGFLVAAAGSESKAGSMAAAQPASPGMWFSEMPALSAYLSRFALPGVRLRVADRHGWISGDSGPAAPTDQAAPTPPYSLALRIYRLLLPEQDLAPVAQASPGRVSGTTATAAMSGKTWISRQHDPDGNRLLLAGAPIRDGERVIGAVLAEQPSDAYLSLTDPAAARLLNLAVLITFGVAAALVLFASVLSWRIGRLRRATQSALDNRGRLQTRMPGSRAGDEIGDLARSFEQLLDRVDEYTRYLHGLGDKLAHELRTPLTVVRSSLDNLDLASLTPADRACLERARGGAERLNTLLSALREANRLEQSLSSSEFEEFDLGEMIDNMADGFRAGFPDRVFETETVAAPVVAAPDLVSQVIDKLVENAVEFSPAGGRIRLSLGEAEGQRGKSWKLAVANDGSRLGPGRKQRYFDSLVTHRTERGNTPHLGLGLYIVRLIAEFHGGSVAAGNSEALSGAEFSVTLPVSMAKR